MPLQIAVVNCSKILPLPPFAALRHLILSAGSTASSADLDTCLQHATALETLCLGVAGQYADRLSSEDIDLSSLHALTHMRMENFAPRRLHVTQGCLLHVVWNEKGSDNCKFPEWAQVQSLWEEQSNRLGSLQVCCDVSEMNAPDIAALKSILTGDQKLAYISLCSPELGNERQPFSVDPSSCQMLALAERVRICCEKVCSISVTDMHPQWKDLSVDAARVNLEVEDTAVLVRSLDNFRIDGIASYGFTSLSMMHELHRAGRKCTVKRVIVKPAEGKLHLQGFSLGTLIDCAAWKRFEELMCCGCSSCLPCLSREGRLSRDSRSPKNFWYRVPVYLL